MRPTGRRSRPDFLMKRASFSQRCGCCRGAAGLPRRARTAQDARAFYDARQAVRQREPAALHRLPRAAPADPLTASPASTSASAPPAGKPPHLVGEHLLKHFGIAPGTREAHAFTYLDFDRGGARRSARWAASRILQRSCSMLKRLAARRAAARRRRHLAGLGDGAVDARPGHGRRAEAPRRRRHDRPLGVHLRRASA